LKKLKSAFRHIGTGAVAVVHHIQPCADFGQFVVKEKLAGLSATQIGVTLAL
jgi:hypothetical protein